MSYRERTDSYGTVGGGTCTRRGIATSLNQVLAPGTVYFTHTGVVNPTISLGHKTETISDEMGPPGKFKGVNHELVDYHLFENGIGHMHEYDRTGRVEISAGSESLWHTFPPPPEFSGTRITLSYDKSIQQCVNAVAHAFYEANQADNLLNLIEFRQLQHGLQGASRLFQSLSRVPRSQLKSWMGKRLVDLNSQFLAYSFGYAPLLSDLKKTYRGMKTMSSELARLTSGPRKVLKTYKSKGNITVDLSNTPGRSDSVPSIPDYSWYTLDINPGDPYLLVGLHGLDTTSYQTSGFRNLDHLLTKYFATGPASLAWELVPFSFVLDWFVDLSPVLDAIDNTVTGKAKSIQRMWVSEKFEVKTTYHKHRCYATNRSSSTSTLHDWQQDGSAIGYCLYKVYRRNLTSVRPMVTASERFGKKQQTLFGALAFQSAANLRRIARH